MARFDFTGFLQQRDDAIERQARAERERQQQTYATWVELSREVGNYVHRNGRRCSVESEFPTINLKSDDGREMIVTVRDRSTYGVRYEFANGASELDFDTQPDELNSDQTLMAAIVNWYEAPLKPKTV